MRRLFTLTSLALYLVLIPCQAVRAGSDSDFLLKSRPKAGDTGDTVELPIRLDVNLEPLFAWTVAVCHDPEVLTIEEVVNGSLLDTINEGDLPDFDSITLFDGGFVAGVIICLFSCDSLPVGDNYEIHTVTYILDGLAPTETDIRFCDDELGVVSNEVVIAGGDSQVPDTIDTTVSIVGPIPLWYTLSTPDTGEFYDVADGLVSFEQTLSLLEHEDNPTFPNAIESLTVTLRHDEAVLEAVDAVAGAELEAVNGGAGPDFFEVDLLADATVINIVVSDTPVDGLVVDEIAEVVVISYEGVVEILTGFPFGLTTLLSFDVADTGAEPNSITSGDYLIGYVLGESEVVLTPRELFLRGDVNDDGTVDFLDATTLLEQLFADGGAIPCQGAADLDENFTINLVDPIYLLVFVFLDGDPPPAPYPVCAFDDADALSCGNYDSCP